MSSNIKIVVEERFDSMNTEDRKRAFNEIFLRIIRKSEEMKAIG